MLYLIEVHKAKERERMLKLYDKKTGLFKEPKKRNEDISSLQNQNENEENLNDNEEDLNENEENENEEDINENEENLNENEENLNENEVQNENKDYFILI